MKRHDRIIEAFEKNQRSNRGKWYWHVKGGNGHIITHSEVYNTKYHCMEMAEQELKIYRAAGLRVKFKFVKIG